MYEHYRIQCGDVQLLMLRSLSSGRPQRLSATDQRDFHPLKNSIYILDGSLFSILQHNDANIMDDHQDLLAHL